MNKIKILIPVMVMMFFLISFAGIFGGTSPKVQNIILQADDTTRYVEVYGASNVVVTIVDSSNSLQDSILVQVRGVDTTSTANFGWSTVAIHDLGQTTTTTNVALMQPGDGVTKSYTLNVNPLVGTDVYTAIRLVRINQRTSTSAAYAGGRTKIGVKSN